MAWNQTPGGPLPAGSWQIDRGIFENFLAAEADTLDRAAGLLERLVTERSQSGGMHVIYRLGGAGSRSTKLAHKALKVLGAQPEHKV